MLAVLPVFGALVVVAAVPNQPDSARVGAATEAESAPRSAGGEPG
jgi:hypothetical protein